MRKPRRRKLNKITKYKNIAKIKIGDEWAVIDIGDVDLVKDYTWHISGGYINTKLQDGKTISLHRLVMDAKDDRSRVIDHRDGDPKNNVKSNLRECSMSQNLHSTGNRRTNTSGAKGVSWHKRSKKWQATATLNFKQYWIGVYDTIEEAAAARDVFIKQLVGEFAITNEDIKKGKKLKQ